MKSFVRKKMPLLPQKVRFLIAWFYWLVEYAYQWIRIRRLKNAGMKEFLIKKISDKKECHILASGWSLNHSFEDIDRNKSFVIGFNFSFLRCSDPDLHFVENASIKNKLFFLNSKQLYYGIKKYSVFKNSTVVFKNMSEIKNSLKLIASYYAKESFFIRDRHYRLFSPEDIDPCVNSMLKHKHYLPQAVSSIIGLIFFSRLMGFKKIIVHGLDFSGPHFYGDNLNMFIFSKQAPAFKLVGSGGVAHKTAIGENSVGTKVLLEVLKKKLKKEGIELFSACAISPSSKVLGAKE